MLTLLSNRSKQQLNLPVEEQLSLLVEEQLSLPVEEQLSLPVEEQLSLPVEEQLNLAVLMLVIVTVVIKNVNSHEQSTKNRAVT